MSEQVSGRHLVVACGGTGGHFYPTLSIAKAFVGLGNRVTLLVAGQHAAEQLETAKSWGIPAVSVPYVRSPRSAWEALAFPFRFLGCFLAARRALRACAPDIMLGMGSYASVPPCLACPSRIPLVLHEGNAFMGKANRMLAKRACAIGLSMPLTHVEQGRGTPMTIVGMPLRESLVQAARKPAPNPEFLPSLGLENGRSTILVFGGSQGARAINELFTSLPPLLGNLKSRLQFIHLTGTDDNQALQDAYRQAGALASIRRADPDIQNCYLAADLVVCRGGASSLCELALFAKPAVIIPLPSAADDHQTVNARFAQSIGGAIHLAQRDASPQAILEILLQLIQEPKRFTDMGRSLQQIAHPDAAERMARLIAQHVP